MFGFQFCDYVPQRIYNMSLEVTKCVGRIKNEWTIKIRSDQWTCGLHWK